MNISKQKGLTFWGFVWGSVLFILFSVLVLKALPPYLDNQKLKNSLITLAAEPNIKTMHRSEMIKRLYRILNIDYADDIVDIKQAFKVKNVQGKKELSIDYELVVPLAYNVSLLFDFTNHVLAPLE